MSNHFATFFVTLRSVESCLSKFYDEAIKADERAERIARVEDAEYFECEEERIRLSDLKDIDRDTLEFSFEHQAEIYAGSIALTLNDALQDLSERLGLETKDVNYGPTPISNIRITRLLFACRNAFAHIQEWRKFQIKHEDVYSLDKMLVCCKTEKEAIGKVSDANKKHAKKRFRQLRSIKILREALGREDIGNHPVFDVLKKLYENDKTYEEIQSMVVAAAKEMAYKLDAKIQGDFEIAKSWSERNPPKTMQACFLDQ